MNAGNSIEVRGVAEYAANLRLYAGLLNQSVYAALEQQAHAVAAEAIKETEKVAPTRGQLEWELIGRITGGGGSNVIVSCRTVITISGEPVSGCGIECGRPSA